MSVYRVVGTVIQLWMFALSGLRRGPAREPFFVLAGLQLIVLILLGQFYSEWFAGALTPLIRRLAGEAATHYPEHLWQLPELYRTTNAFLMVFFGVIAHAAAVRGFAACRSRWPEAFLGAPSLMAIAVLTTGVAWAITSSFNLIPIQIALRSTAIRLGLQAAELGMIIILLSVLAFAPVFVVLEGASFGRAVAGSWRMFRTHPWHVLLLVAVPMGVLFPPTFFLYEMNLDDALLVPEVVGLILVGLVVVRTLFDALVIGGVTRLYLGSRKDSR